jgi:hypothetical protein
MNPGVPVLPPPCITRLSGRVRIEASSPRRSARHDELSAPSIASMTDGLSQAEANQRLDAVGPNQIAHEQPPSAWRLLAGQFNSPVIGLLLGACIVSGALGEWVDALAIGAIVDTRRASRGRIVSGDSPVSGKETKLIAKRLDR